MQPANYPNAVCEVSTEGMRLLYRYRDIVHNNSRPTTLCRPDPTPPRERERHVSGLTFHVSSSNPEKKARPLEGLRLEARAKSHCLLISPQIDSASRRYSLGELGIIAEVMTVMMSPYLVQCRPPSPCPRLSNVPPFIKSSTC